MSTLSDEMFCGFYRLNIHQSLDLDVSRPTAYDQRQLVEAVIFHAKASSSGRSPLLPWLHLSQHPCLGYVRV